jgi:3-carboxy-cis,cis-muconate cycloisomerase
MDTATVLCLRDALGHLGGRLDRVIELASRLAETHRHTVMAARTHGQQAVVSCFGLAVAGWLAPLVHARARLPEVRGRLERVQLGGAAGTLSAMGPRGLAVVERLAEALALRVPDMPWHTQREALSELAAWGATTCASLGKMAQDVVLLTQTEVGELSEAPPGQRGGSSSMPHKNNPVRSEQILAAARTTASLAGAVLGAAVQEHQRGTHGWQVEWLNLAPLVRLTGGALANAETLLAGLRAYPERMRENLSRAGDVALSEAAVCMLSRVLPRADAQALVKAAAVRAAADGRLLSDALSELLAERDSDAFDPGDLDWSSLTPERHLGQAQAFIDRVLARARGSEAPRGSG